MGQPASPIRVLVLCTGNSARSQIAEALLTELGQGRVLAGSAGSHPAAAVNPWAIQVLQEAGIKWSGHPPRGLDGLEAERWDLVITVCDNARESCPVLPGRPVTVHWGMEDPAEVNGPDQRKREAFSRTLRVLRDRIGRLLALPLESLDQETLRRRVREIGSATD